MERQKMMGSSRSNENEVHQQRQGSREEQLVLFSEIQKQERERKNPNRMYDATVAGETVHADNSEHMGFYFDASPLISAGTPMEAIVGARLASSSSNQRSKPIMRYSSKRNNTDLLTFDMGKTDYDWLMTPPVTPFTASTVYTTKATAEGKSSHRQPNILAMLHDVDLKYITKKSETSNNAQPDTTSSSSVVAASSDHMSAASFSNHAKQTISSNLSNSTTKVIHNADGNPNGNYTKSISKPEGEASTHIINSNSSNKPSAKGFSSHVNSRPTSKESLRSTIPAIRSGALPSIVTTMNETQNPYKSTTAGSSLALTSPRVGTSTNAKESTVVNVPSKAPTISQKQSKSTASNGGGTRSSSIGRGAIHISSNNSANAGGFTNKLRKGSRKTSSSRVGSPETTPNMRVLPCEPSEMLGLSSEAPPNLRTTVSTRSISASRGSRQPTTPTNNTNTSNSTSRNTSRSASVSKERSTSTSKSSDTRSNSSAYASTTSRGSNNKGTTNSNVLGSKMVDKVMQARQAASSSASHSLTSISPLTSPVSASSSSMSPPLSAASLPSSSRASKSTRSSSSSASPSPSSTSLSSLLTSRSTLSSLQNTQAKSHGSHVVHPELNSQLQHNKYMVKQCTSNTVSTTTSLLKDTTPGFNSRTNQSSKTKPMQVDKEAHVSDMISQPISQVPVKFPNNETDLENNMRYTEFSNVDHFPTTRNMSKNSTTISAMEKDNDKQEVDHQHQPLQQFMCEESSDFSNELNAIMQKDQPRYHGTFPSTRNMRKKATTISAMEKGNHKQEAVDQQHQQLQQFMSEESSDFSNELNAIMRQDQPHYHGVLPNTRNMNKKSTTTKEKDNHKQEAVDQQHQLQQYFSEESSDFSNESNGIMRKDRSLYHGVFPSKDIIKVSNNWLMNSPDYLKDDSVELMNLFKRGIERYGISESPLVCPHGALGNCVKCNNADVKGVRKAGPHSSNLRPSHKYPDELWKGSPY